uniref:RNA-directed DNA polymerase n=2 Tax=Lygus hesperus TaxID=30085 RepID=A0A0A9XPD5_LYGHE
MEDILSKMANNKVFSTFDVRQAYLHMQVDEESAKLLTINTSKGLFRVHRLMYGIASAPSKWQKRMDALFGKLPFLSIFFDDASIASPDEQTHLRHIREFFEICRSNGIRLNKSKCKLMKKEITYLGHKIDENGLHKTTDKIAAIQNAKPPKDISELRSFLGVVNYYSRFIPSAAELLHKFYELLKKGVEFKWNDNLQRDFERIKEELASPRVLAHFDPQKPVIVAADASSYGLGGVISHIYHDGSEHPIAFASRTLTDTEKKYPQVEKEALSIIWALKKFFHYVYGRPFILQTDHKPLTQIFNPSKETPPLSATRLAHYAIFLQGFNYQIRYRQTNKHSNADYCSRLSTSTISDYQDEPEIFQCNQLNNLPISSDIIAAETARDPETKNLLSAIVKGEIKNNAHEYSIQDGCIFRGTRVLIPPSLRKTILEELHDGHLGAQKMRSIARSYVYWENIDQDISLVTRECPACIRYAKSPNRIIHRWLPPEAPWQRVHLDHAGPFFNKYFLIVIDAYTRWIEVFIVPSLTPNSNIPFLRETFARFGLPNVIVSDNHGCFTSSEFKTFLRENNIKHVLTPAFHPSSNGQVERYVQTVKSGLRKALFGKPLSGLHSSLQNFLLHYRKAPHCATGSSPAREMLGRDIRTRLDTIIPTKQPGKPSSRAFQLGDEVAFRKDNEKEWIIGTVTSTESNSLVNIRTPLGQYRRHIDHVIKLPVSHSPEEPYENEGDSINLHTQPPLTLGPADSALPHTSTSNAQSSEPQSTNQGGTPPPAPRSSRKSVEIQQQIPAPCTSRKSIEPQQTTLTPKVTQTPAPVVTNSPAKTAAKEPVLAPPHSPTLRPVRNRKAPERYSP